MYVAHHHHSLSVVPSHDSSSCCLSCQVIILVVCRSKCTHIYHMYHIIIMLGVTKQTTLTDIHSRTRAFLFLTVYTLFVVRSSPLSPLTKLLSFLHPFLSFFQKQIIIILTITPLSLLLATIPTILSRRTLLLLSHPCIHGALHLFHSSCEGERGG